MRRVRDRRVVAMAAIAVVIGALYFWTALGSPESGNYYGLLTDGFLDGTTSLPVDPAPELLALDDPYDPVQNAPWRLHDASLYDGRYYLYFGPTPVVLVYLPLRVVGVHASEALAAATLAFAGFLFALALMRFLIERYRPRTSLVTQVVAGLLLGIANVAPFLLRRPAVYEVAIAAGFACLMAGIHLTLTAVLRERPSLWRLAGGSMAFGLAVGARPNLVVAIPIWIWAWHRLWRAREPGGPSVARITGAALGPAAGCAVLLMIYNAVRFGSPAEFGSTYQLAGVNMNLYDRFALDRLLPGAWSYFLAPPRFDVIFPFAHLDPRYTGVLPDFYAAGVEPVAGLLATTPLVLAAFAAPVILIAWGRRQSPADRESMVLATLLLGTALLVVLVPIVSFDAATQRYEVDFATLFLLAALLVWLWLEDHARPAAVRVALRALGATAAAVAIAIALAFSVTGYYDGLRTGQPGVYDALERAFSLVPVIAAEQRGHPVVLRIDGTGAPVAETRIRVASAEDGTSALTATFTWNTAVPPGGSVIADVAASGTSRSISVTGAPQAVPVALRRGITTITVRWRSTIAPEIPAGSSVTGVSLGPVEPVPVTR